MADKTYLGWPFLEDRHRELKAQLDDWCQKQEFKHDEDTVRFIFLENGVCEFYINGKKEEEANWSIVDGEIHAKTDDGVTGVLRINPDKSITRIAMIDDRKRTDASKEYQYNYKRIK